MFIGGKEVKEPRVQEFRCFTYIGIELMRMETGVRMQEKIIIYKLNSSVNEKND